MVLVVIHTLQRLTFVSLRQGNPILGSAHLQTEQRGTKETICANQNEGLEGNFFIISLKTLVSTKGQKETTR